MLFNRRYEAHEKGLVSADGVEFVPDVYTKNQNLEQDVQHLQKEAEKFRLAALYDFYQYFDLSNCCMSDLSHTRFFY